MEDWTRVLGTAAVHHGKVWGEVWPPQMEGKLLLALMRIIGPEGEKKANEGTATFEERGELRVMSSHHI